MFDFFEFLMSLKLVLWSIHARSGDGRQGYLFAFHFLPLFLASRRSIGLLPLVRLKHLASGRYEYTTSRKIAETLVLHFGFIKEENLGYVLQPDIFLLNSFSSVKFKKGLRPENFFMDYGHTRAEANEYIAEAIVAKLEGWYRARK